MAGSHPTSAREPGQVRKEAALSGHRRAAWGRPCRSREQWTRPGNRLRRRVHGPLFPWPGTPGTEARLLPPVPQASASLYRRHRPRTFADVVGQEHVVRTLRNALEQDRVHHAYLFVGSRGTGKTSMAKILAASLNCEHGPTVTPCGTCASCRAIAEASSLDVIEMDAASNNSVDDIRDLREKVAYAPVSGRHKVYILDEAHMLTTAAWNAFLKTLEEPPPHTIFVLATTEANKVLPTVVDRCHRFDFARPTQRQIAGVLRRVADAEEIVIPDEACALIARSATGSFRDALGHARAARLLLGRVDHARGRAGGARRGRRGPAVRRGRRGRRRRRARRAAGRRAAGRLRARRRALLRRLRGAPARADDRADARRGRGGDPRHARAGRAAHRAGAARRPGDRPAAARPGRQRAARDEGRRRPADPARARARQGGPARARPVAAGADGPARAARGGPSRRAPRPPRCTARRSRPRRRRARRGAAGAAAARRGAGRRRRDRRDRGRPRGHRRRRRGAHGRRVGARGRRRRGARPARPLRAVARGPRRGPGAPDAATR